MYDLKELGTQTTEEGGRNRQNTGRRKGVVGRVGNTPPPRPV